MDDREQLERVRETISRLSDDRLLAMLAGPEGDYTPEALECARAELRSRGGVEFVAQRERDRPPSPDRYVAEYPSEDEVLASSFNGCGTAFYGSRERLLDGSYVTTKWIVVAHLPIMPRGSFRVRLVSKRSGLFTTAVSYAGHSVPLSRPQVMRTYVLTYGSLGALLALVALLA